MALMNYKEIVETTKTFIRAETSKEDIDTLTKIALSVEELEKVHSTLAKDYSNAQAQIIKSVKNTQVRDYESKEPEVKNTDLESIANAVIAKRKKGE